MLIQASPIHKHTEQSHWTQTAICKGRQTQQDQSKRNKHDHKEFQPGIALQTVAPPERSLVVAMGASVENTVDKIVDTGCAATGAIAGSVAGALVMSQGASITANALASEIVGPAMVAIFELAAAPLGRLAGGCLGAVVCKDFCQRRATAPVHLNMSSLSPPPIPSAQHDFMESQRQRIDTLNQGNKNLAQEIKEQQKRNVAARGTAKSNRHN